MNDDTKQLNEAKAADVAKADTLTPADRYQELFIAVQMGCVFTDSKTFVDCAPRGDPEQILEDYRGQCDDDGFDLSGFVHRHFAPPEVHASHYVSPPGQPLKDHIDSLWGVLTRHPREHPSNSSILPLPNAYVVPGGRFGELYYWDSYFTMLGLAESGRHDLLASMANNFAYLIDTYGHVPNGNRTYYLSRSQPPMFALMIELFEQHGVCKAIERLLWNEKAGAFLDYDWQRDGPRESLNGTAAVPLFVGLASREQAERTTQALRDRLLREGGLGTSEHDTGQQWDQPNGWAPLQWMAICGMRNYGITLADDIACRWLKTVGSLYKQESKLVEKYVITHDGESAEGGGGGEYPLQDGFGWTNGVTRRLLHEDPGNEANEAKAASR
jgi:neutral trehalase